MNPHVFDGVLAAAQQAEEWAWAQLHAWLAPQLGGYLRTRGLVDPEDIVGEVFLQMARNLSSFTGDMTGFRSWVFMIAHNRLINERRRIGRRPATLTSDISQLDDQVALSAEDQAIQHLGIDRVAELLERLTEDQREVVALRVVVGFSVDETARITGKTASSVKQLQRRGLNSLRKHLQERV